jgi:putative endopeptidase
MRLGRLFLAAVSVSLLAGQNASRSSIHPDDMDPTCKPCTDFWRYVNGGWLDKNPIPADQPSWGTFEVLRDANRERIRSILESTLPEPGNDASGDKARMASLYSGCMNTAKREADGIAPLRPLLERVEQARSVGDIAALIADYERSPEPHHASISGSVAAPFLFTAGQDDKYPSRVVAQIVERDGNVSSVLSLPDRDYYFKADDKSQQIRTAFVQHVAKMLEFAGVPHSEMERQARDVLAFETDLAASMMTTVERRVPENIYHMTSLSGLKTLAPAFDWAGLLKSEGLAATTQVNVTEPELLKKFNRQLETLPVATWQTWLRWRVLRISAPYLSPAIAAESFRFQNTVLRGTPQEPPRWESCGVVIDQDLGDALGKIYVAKYFPPQAKRRMAVMFENLRAALRQEIEDSEWLSPETKKNALKKLNAMKAGVGYPDDWQGYSDVQIDPAKYFESVRNTWVHAQRHQMASIGKPVNHNDWYMTPPTVNAYADWNRAEVVFTAGILQPPFFDAEAEDALNYGAIGAVIGHEMTHQFDDGGSKYDSTGALRNWWTDGDSKAFESRTACIVEQFDKFDVADGLHHNGKQVLGEALGDLSGLSMAYNAYRLSLIGKPEPPVIDGFTADQRFFVAFARVWGRQLRPEALRLQLATNAHPIARFRAIGTLQNMPEFQRAFQCKPGDPMVRPAPDRCKVW